MTITTQGIRGREENLGGSIGLFGGMISSMLRLRGTIYSLLKEENEICTALWKSKSNPALVESGFLQELNKNQFIFLL